MIHPSRFTNHQPVIKLCRRSHKENNFYVASTTAKILSVSENTLHKLSVLGKIPHIIVRRKFYYAKPEVEAFMILHKEGEVKRARKRVDYWLSTEDACKILEVNYSDLEEMTDLGLMSCIYLVDSKPMYREDELYELLSEIDHRIDLDSED